MMPREETLTKPPRGLQRWDIYGTSLGVDSFQQEISEHEGNVLPILPSGRLWYCSWSWTYSPKKYFLQMDHRDKRCLQKGFFWSIKVLYLWTFPWAQKNSFKICKQETLAYIFKGAAQPGSKPERKKPFTAIMSINQSINLSKLYCRLAAPTKAVQQK